MRSFFKITTKISELTNWIDTDGLFPDALFDNSSSIGIRFDSLLIEEEHEEYVYGIGNFIVALGGNLGLMLGFSCLSVLFLFIEFVFKMVH
jgi:hypothetical protein